MGKRGLVFQRRDYTRVLHMTASPFKLDGDVRQPLQRGRRAAAFRTG